MSTVDANRVLLTGENSVIRLSKTDSDIFTANATFWRILSSPGGPGHVLYLKSERTENRWRIYSDNIAMARWLQSTVLGAINAELLDLTIAVTDAQFSKSGDARDFWTERLDTRDEQIVLTWYEFGEPLLVHTQPNAIPGRPYGMCTVLVPALGARLTRNGIEAVLPAPASWDCAKAGRRPDRRSWSCRSSRSRTGMPDRSWSMGGAQVDRTAAAGRFRLPARSSPALLFL
jgi:hypothetical protein